MGDGPRVLLSFPTRFGTPGVGTTAWHQVTGLVAAGAQVALVAGSVERPAPGARVLAQTMRVGPVKIPYRAVGLRRATAHHDRVAARIVRRHAAEFDIVHAWPMGAERTLHAARAEGIPGLLERPNTHAAFGFEVVAQECARLGLELDPHSPHAFDPARLAQEEREYAAAGALLCPSPFVAETHAARGADRSTLLRHQYGYDPARFTPPAERAEGLFTAVFVGRLEPRKGVHLLLEAWERAGLAGRGRLVLCGPCDAGYNRVLEPLAARAQAEVVGPVDDPRAVMAASDVLVLPSLEEGSALVTYEARASGCVLVVSDRAGAVVHDGRDALVHEAGDVAQLAAQLAALAGDPARLDALRQASLAAVADLTWDAAAQSLLRAYAQAG